MEPLKTSSRRCLIGCAIPACVAFAVWYTIQKLYSPELENVCYVDFEQGETVQCRPLCPHGSFSVMGMAACVPWLSCANFNDITIIKKIGGGAVKEIFLAEWQGHLVAVNQLKEPLYREDFEHGLQMLSAFHPHQHVSQLLGQCMDKFVTEYHRHQSAEHLVEMLETDQFFNYNTPKVRLGLCINYVELLAFLHNNLLGIHVMCDSNDLQKTLDQLLVTTDLRLLLNDLDALPKVVPPNVKIKCGHREIDTDFAAPEQRWPFSDQPFNDDLLPPYDEKSDVWKIPDVCLHFLGNHPRTMPIRFHLFKIHNKCKMDDPSQRPDALEVLSEYRKVKEKFGL